MAIHHPTPPLGGGERPRLPSAQVGPVTQAIRAMRLGNFPTLANEAERAKAGCASCTPFNGSTFVQRIRALSRAEIEDLISGLIDLLDAMDGDPDAEPSLGSINATSHSDFMDQESWSHGYGQDREAGDDNGIADDDGMAWATRRVA